MLILGMFTKLGGFRARWVLEMKNEVLRWGSSQSAVGNGCRQKCVQSLHHTQESEGLPGGGVTVGGTSWRC